MHFLKDEVKMTSEWWNDTGTMGWLLNKKSMMGSVDRMTLEWRDGAGKKSEQILIASIPVHPVILERSWDDSRMTEWLDWVLNQWNSSIPAHPVILRRPWNDFGRREWPRMTRNFEARPLPLIFFLAPSRHSSVIPSQKWPSLYHPVILLSWQYDGICSIEVISLKTNPVLSP